MADLTKTVSTKNDVYKINLREKLGDGAFAIVYGAYSAKRKAIVAVKVVKKKALTARGKENLRKEVLILKSLNHPNVLKFFDVHDEPRFFYIFTRKMKTDMLEEIIASPSGHLDEVTTRFLVMQMLAALRYLHSQDVAHCDLKPENILLEENLRAMRHPLIQLCDFGYARIMNSVSVRNSAKGTPLYSPREILLKIRHDRSIDIWSMGVIIFVSLSGTFPFDGDEEIDIADDIQRKVKKPSLMYPKASFSDVSKEGVGLLKEILTDDYSNLTVSKIIKHSWFKDRRLEADLKSLEKRLNKNIYTSLIH